MAIGTDACIDFFGTQDILGTTPATVVNAAISLVGDLSEWVNDDDAKEAEVILEWDTGDTGTADTTVDLYMQQMNIVGGNDEEAPDVTNFLVKYQGSFHYNNPGTDVQYATVTVSLPNTKTSSVYNFYILNKTGQTIADTWDLTVAPKAPGPHA